MAENSKNHKIVPFDFHGRPVRVILFEDGRKEWLATDACDALELSNPSMAINGLDDDERGKVIVLETDLSNTESGVIPRTYLTVTEAGLYKLVLRSRKPGAKVFSRWVTHEVLPAIQRQGYYVAPGNEAKALVEIQARLVEMCEQQSQMSSEMATYRAAYEGERTTVAQLTTRVEALSQRFKDFDDDHPNGLFGKKEAKELSSIICQWRDIALQLSDKYKPITVFIKIDNNVRSRVGYVRSSAASWEFATISVGRDAKSFAARELEAARRELRDEHRRQKREVEASQLALGFADDKPPRKHMRRVK